jgi:hypothetical protein
MSKKDVPIFEWDKFGWIWCTVATAKLARKRVSVTGVEQLNRQQIFG